MRILHIAGYTVERGGTSKVAFDNMSYQLSQGHSVDIITVEFPDEELYTLPDGVGLIKVKFSPLNKLIPDFSMGIYNYLKNNEDKYDIIHIHGIWHWGSIVPFLVTSKPRIIISIHGMLSKWALGQGGIKKKVFGKIFQKRFLKKADGIIVLTELEKEELLEYISLDDSKIRVIPNGIEKPRISSKAEKEALREDLRLSQDSICVLFLSRIHKKKGLDLLIKAFSILLKKYPEAILLIAGPDEGYRHKVEELIVEFNIEANVRFLGAVSGDLKDTVFSIADLFVLSSYSEGLPMAVLEAMTYQIPVIVSNQTRIDSFIKEYVAGKVVDLNHSEIYDAMLQIIEAPSETKNIIENANKLVEKEFGPSKINKEIIEFYSSLTIKQPI